MGLFRKVKHSKERFCVSAVKFARFVREISRRLCKRLFREEDEIARIKKRNSRKTAPLPPATTRHSANCLYAEREFAHEASTSQSFSSTSSCALNSFYDESCSSKKCDTTLNDLTFSGKCNQSRRRLAKHEVTDVVGIGSVLTNDTSVNGSSLAEKCTTLLSMFGNRNSIAPKASYINGNKPSYKARKWFCCRKSDAIQLQQKYPDKIPIIMERFRRETRLPQLSRTQYVVPKYTTVGQLQHLLRTLLFDQSNMAIFIVVNDEVPSMMTSVEELSLRHREEDGFLYIQFTSEDFFG